MIKVKNESELMHLLKIVSSEAAGLSKKLFEGKDTECSTKPTKKCTVTYPSKKKMLNKKKKK